MIPARSRGRALAGALGLAVALAPLVSCAGGGLRGSGSASAASPDVEELKRRVLDLQRRAAVTEVELERLRQTVAELESRLRTAAGPRSGERPRAAAGTVPTPAPLVATPPVLRPPAIEERDLAEPALPTPAPLHEPDALEPVTPQGQSAYDHAYTLYHQGRFIDAETAFRRFLQNWPRTDLADNASYWIGESRYSRGDLRSALAAFRETVERFPAGNKTPDALYKAGQCLEGLGDTESARQSYQANLERYATEPAAELARERLRVLG